MSVSREAVLREFHPTGELGYSSVRSSALADEVIRQRARIVELKEEISDLKDELVEMGERGDS